MLQIRLDPMQTRARAALRPGVIATLAWGRGSGKTYFGRTMIHEWCLERPGAHVGLLMPTLKQARATFWPMLLSDYYGGLRPYLRSKPNLTELVCEYANGSRLSTWGAENANTIRGQRFDRLVQDEADDIGKDVEDAVVEPTFSRSGSHAIWLKMGTPRKGRYGSLFIGYRSGQEGTPERQALVNEGLDPRGYVSMRFRSIDSPQVDHAWLDKVRRGLIASGRKSIYEREYECNFDAADGLVYSMFSHETHVREPDYGVPWTEILVGVDHGWHDPGVMLVIGVIGTGRDAVMHCIDEVYESKRENSWWDGKASEIAVQYRNKSQRWYADRSRPDRIHDLRKAIRSVNPEMASIYESDSSPGSVERGVSAVADRLCPRVDPSGDEHVRIYVSPKCVNTIREMSLYARKRDPKNDDHVLDDIVSENDHALDCLRYAAVGRFGGPDRQRHELGPQGRQYPATA